MSKLQIKLAKGLIGTNKKQKSNVQALGLRKREQVVIKEDTPQIRGMIKQVSHLLEVKEISE